MDPYEALREYDAEYRREELELAQIQDEIKAVRAEIESEEKVCVALEAESLELDRDIENAELRRAAIAAKMDSVRKEDEKIMPELMKRREKLEKQERMRAAMETAIRKRAEFVDKMVADYKAKIYGLPRMVQYMQVKDEVEALEQAVEEKKKNMEELKEVIRARKEKEKYVWEEFKKLCIQGAKNWKRASEEAKKKEEEAAILQTRKKLVPPNSGPPRYSWMSQSVKPKLAAFSPRTKLGSSSFSFYKKPETSSSSLLWNLAQPTRKGITDDGFLTNIDQQTEQFIRTSTKEREALLSRATSRLTSRFGIGNIDSTLTEGPHNRDQGPSSNEAKTPGSLSGSTLVPDQDVNFVVTAKEAKPPRRVTYAPLPTSDEYPLPVLEKHMKEPFSRPNSVASSKTHDPIDGTAAQKRCRSAAATSLTSTASIGSPLAAIMQYANKMDTDDGKKSKSLEHNFQDLTKDAPNYAPLDDYMSSQGGAGDGGNYDNGGFFAEIQQDAGLPAFGYSDENMEHEGQGDHPFGRYSPPGEFDFPNPFG